MQPQQIACITFHTERKTFHGAWKVPAFLEALSFLTNLRLPSVVQHLRRRIRIDDAAGLPHSQAARAIMNTMLELLAAHRNPFDTNAVRSACARERKP
ncbi:hypothetical protein JFN94_28400 [Burkholderia anthina]|uniref:Uncharacterized protein n=1 Tax=Burkholderia anthina TaxID=179879 RepID=A0A7T6VJR2_9BURK|nr:hypothetical protein [Burkholderia anthina]QQK05211.1 hypothetical protein JFN94_28400 [Burkholderia anthina]